MKKKILTYPIVIVFVAYLFFILAMSLLTPSVVRDENENRELAQRPFINDALSFNSFAKDWDNFVSDQFPFRNHIVEAVNIIEESQGASVVQDVYTLDSDYLFMFTYPVEDWRLATITRLMTARETKTSVPFVYAIAPYKNMLLAEGVDGLSSTTDMANLKKTIKAFEEGGVSYIDLCSPLMGYSLEERGEMFYKSDVHWTDKGAYEGSKILANGLADLGIISKVDVPRESNFVWSDFTGRNFEGDIANLQGTKQDFNEYIPVYEIADKDSCYYYMKLDNSEEISRDDIIETGLNGDGGLDYSSVAMRNYPYLRVENPHANKDMSVLILRDSFQCATVDYFSQLFSEVNMVDPRFAAGGYTLDEIMEARDIDLVICMYHCNNASTELIQYIK